MRGVVARYLYVIKKISYIRLTIHFIIAAYG